MFYEQFWFWRFKFWRRLQRCVDFGDAYGFWRFFGDVALNFGNEMHFGDAPCIFWKRFVYFGDVYRFWRRVAKMACSQSVSFLETRWFILETPVFILETLRFSLEVRSIHSKSSMGLATSLGPNKKVLWPWPHQVAHRQKCYCYCATCAAYMLESRLALCLHLALRICWNLCLVLFVPNKNTCLKPNTCIKPPTPSTFRYKYSNFDVDNKNMSQTQQNSENH